MRNLKLFFISMIFPVALIAQNQLVIEVTTDNYPEETYWRVYDLTHTIVKQSGELQKLTTYRDTLLLTSENCYYWTIYDKYSDGMSSAGGGDFKIYFDDVLVARCENPNFGDSLTVYNLGYACSPNDAALLNVEMQYYLSKESQPIAVNLLNMGKEPITQVEGYYIVNNNSSNTLAINGLSIPVGGVQTIYHPDEFDFETAGFYSLTFVVTTINGVPDSYSANNSVTKEVEVLNGIVKKNMVEMMTSRGCSYCPEANEKLDNALAVYPGTFSLAKYLVWADYDNKYIPENEERFNYYNAGGAPWLFINGVEANWLTMSDEVYESNYLGKVSDLKITIGGYMKGDSIFTNVTILPMSTLVGEFYLRGNAVQRECHDNKKSSDYLHPVYGYLPNPNGILIQGFEQGIAQHFQINSGIFKYPLEEGSLQEMIVNFFVQRKVDKQILQSENKRVTYTEVNPMLTFNINDNATLQDTSGLQIVVTSNRSLLQKDGRPIQNIKDHLVFKKDAITGAAVPFSAVLNETSSAITIKPTYGWTPGSTYYLVCKDFSTLDGILLAKDTLVFTTKIYTGVNNQATYEVEVYPTVTSDGIYINSPNKTSFKICNSLGQKVMELNNMEGKIYIPVYHLPKGVYYLMGKESTNGQGVKFLKQ